MDTSQDLQGFSQFVASQLASGAPTLPEDCLSLWRAEHPLPEELRESVLALQGSLDDLNNSHTHDFGEVNQAIRDRHGWSSR